MLNWYLQTGKDSNIVMSSKVALSRNLSQFNFYIKEDEIFKLENLIQENLMQIGYGLKLIKLRDLNKIKLQILYEKGLIKSKELQNSKRVSILINDEENICIIINSEDHLRLQVFASGLDIDAITNLCIEIDEKLQALFNIAQSPKYGYLTANLSNVGTGMKISVILHLPGLSKTKNIQKVKTFVRQFGIEIKTKQASDFYQISNEKTLGITEENIVKKLKSITEEIIQQEKLARKILTENQIKFEDTIFRSYGILMNCKQISQSEAQQLLSNVKLGTDLGILTDLTDVKIRKLYLYIQPANISEYFGQELTMQEQNVKRAEVIKQITKD